MNATAQVGLGIAFAEIVHISTSLTAPRVFDCFLRNRPSEGVDESDDNLRRNRDDELIRIADHLRRQWIANIRNFFRPLTRRSLDIIHLWGYMCDDVPTTALRADLERDSHLLVERALCWNEYLYRKMCFQCGKTKLPIEPRFAPASSSSCFWGDQSTYSLVRVTTGLKVKPPASAQDVLASYKLVGIAVQGNQGLIILSDGDHVIVTHDGPYDKDGCRYLYMKKNGGREIPPSFTESNDEWTEHVMINSSRLRLFACDRHVEEANLQHAIKWDGSSEFRHVVRGLAYLRVTFHQLDGRKSTEHLLHCLHEDGSGPPYDVSKASLYVYGALPDEDVSRWLMKCEASALLDGMDPIAFKVENDIIYENIIRAKVGVNTISEQEYVDLANMGLMFYLESDTSFMWYSVVSNCLVVYSREVTEDVPLRKSPLEPFVLNLDDECRLIMAMQYSWGLRNGSPDYSEFTEESKLEDGACFDLRDYLAYRRESINNFVHPCGFVLRARHPDSVAEGILRDLTTSRPRSGRIERYVVDTLHSWGFPMCPSNCYYQAVYEMPLTRSWTYPGSLSLEGIEVSCDKDYRWWISCTNIEVISQNNSRWQTRAPAGTVTLRRGTRDAAWLSGAVQHLQGAVALGSSGIFRRTDPPNTTA